MARPATGKARTSSYTIAPELLARVSELATHFGCSKSYIVEQALTLYLSEGEARKAMARKQAIETLEAAGLMQEAEELRKR